MEYITVSAKTLDDAITEAQVQLGVTRDNLDYEVIEKGSAGFLGIGMKQAVIKARRKKEEPAFEEIIAEEISIVKEESDEKKEESVRERKEYREHKEHREHKERKENREDKKDITSKKNNQRKKNKRDFDKKEKKQEPVLKEVPERKEIELAKVEPQTIEACEQFIYNVLNAMDMEDVKVTSEVDEEGALAITMEGNSMGILIGKRGQTLDSLQYLTNRVANKMQSGYVRVKLDTEDYRRRRKETLENLARNIASKVKRTRKTVSLEPMNPYERRIIHSTLQADPAVATHSEGEEPYRRVVVTLVRNR